MCALFFLPSYQQGYKEAFKPKNSKKKIYVFSEKTKVKKMKTLWYTLKYKTYHIFYYIILKGVSLGLK